MNSAYDRKFEEMKGYIPFLERMINKLLSTSDSATTNPRQGQLDKIRSLRDLLLNKNKRMKMENLLKCEQVLINLYTKLEQSDPSSTSNPVNQPSTSNDKTELETVRNKLKTVAKIQEDGETLPEISRANNIELNYTGSKEPALFQRRPNKTSNSPVRSAESLCETDTDTPQPHNKRNYTRVLMSPDRNDWSSPEKSSSDKPLFSRRSPPKIISPHSKKEKKKKKYFKSRKTNEIDGFELKLNVPQNSLNSEDIISRLIKSDVDIDTLGVCRTKIIAELKRMGKNEDISDLILKSYDCVIPNRKKKSTGKHSKEDVEEGELSDSESEAIESIYGGLPVTDKSSNTLKTKKERRRKKDQTKINICLPPSDKIESDITAQTKEQPYVIDHVNELEMCNEKKSDNRMDIISDQTKTIIINEESNESVPDDIFNKTGEIKELSKANLIEEATKPSTESNNDLKSPNKSHSEDDLHTKLKQEFSEQRPKFVANFYKPIEEQHSEIPSSTGTVISPVQPTSICPNNGTSKFPEKRNNEGCNKNSANIASESKNCNKESTSISEKSLDDSQNIPLLNEPTVPPKAKTSVLSEIDILQALKNEILSDSIPVPGTETITPSLHQPKLIKVANAQEVLPKKKISIEKYKEKVSTSTTKPLFFKSRKRENQIKEDVNRKQSLKLTDKECERFNFPKRLSLDDDDDDDIDDISDCDFLMEGKDDSLGLDDIYGDLAPKSPDSDKVNKNTTPPVIIPTDSKSFEVNVVKNRGDVDMRALLPSTPQPQPVPPPLLSPLMPSVGHGTVPPSPSYGIVRNVSEVRLDSNNAVPDDKRIRNVDPRKRHDPRISSVNSPNSYVGMNAETAPRSFSSVVSGASNNQSAPIMAPNMTPSYTPSIPQLRMSNARTFEMTPSHQTFELEETTSRKHVYAPSFSVGDNRERDLSVSKDGPYWDTNKTDLRNRKSKWTDSNKHTGEPTWEDHTQKTGQNDGSYTPRYEDSFTPKFDNYNNRKRSDKYNTQDVRDSYSKVDCPATPIPSFGWSECPPTPSSAFGRQEAPMTPIHAFGRSDCPTTPIHPFGRGDCPATPSSGFGRGVEVASNHSYNISECPPTPSHSFGRSECPQTPSHPFGRNECPRTPSHPFGRNECPRTPSHPFGHSESGSYNRPDISNNYSQKYSKDPRLNRKPAEYELNSYNERDYGYNRERDRNSTAYKSQSKPCSGVDVPRRYERERSVGRNDRDYGDHNMPHYDRNRREKHNMGTSIAIKGIENDRFSSKNRESRYDTKYSKDCDIGFIHNRRDKSVGLSSDNKQNVERSHSRTLSVGRSTGKEQNKDKISFQSENGRNFIINTSVKSTFQDFISSNKSIQAIENTFDARRQRAASVGRSLQSEDSGRRMLAHEPVGNYSTYEQERNSKFKRASSVGREMLKPDKTFQELKADLKSFKPQLNKEKDNGSKNTNKSYKIQSLQEKFEAFKSTIVQKESTKHINQPSLGTKKGPETSHQDRKYAQSRHNFSTKQNYRDPRLRTENKTEIKSRYKIDRRPDSRGNKSSGIIYSNDNIARGTIMRSGFGVKNYKIPKIKRVEPEIPETTTDEKDIVESFEKNETQKNSKENDKKTKSKLLTEPDLSNEEKAVTNDNRDKKVNKNLNDDNMPEVRVTRSKKIIDSKIPDDDDVTDEIVKKSRKSKKSIIPIQDDSDSDSVTEKDIPKSSTFKSGVKTDTQTKNSTPTKDTLLVEKEHLNKEVEETLDSNFAIDDMELFPENLESTMEKDNINALIAGLDNDFSTSKNSNERFATDFEKLDSPEGSSVGDISEIIEKDLNKCNKIQKDSIANSVSNTIPVTEDLIQKQSTHNSDCSIADNASQLIDGVKTSDTNNFTTDIEIAGESNFPKDTLDSTNLPKATLNNTNSPNTKDNEAIVSTTGVDQGKKEDKDTNVDVVSSNFDQSIPDSSINKGELNKTSDGLPDSTNEIHSEVTSTNDSAEFPNKESQVKNTNQNEKFNSIESILSILQDKSRIKELLAMLGDQSSDNDKIKKKLEKLSKIVSDEDDEEEKKSESKEERVIDTALTKATTEETIIANMTDNASNCEISHKSQDQENKESPVTDVENNIADISMEYNTSNNSVLDTAETLIKTISDTTEMNKINNKEKTNKKNKLGDEGKSDERDDEPLVKTKIKKNKKIKSKNSKGKFKAATKKVPVKNLKKLNTRATPGKTGIKKRGELQKLQEDLKEFMCDNINASGIRMCRLAKMVNEKETVDPVVALEKVNEAKEVQNKEQPPKLRKKPGPKPKNKTKEKKLEITKSPEIDENLSKLKPTLKYKPGPKSKTKPKSDETDPYEFDTDSVADKSITKESDDDSSDSENESLISSRSFGSSEVLADTIKKPKRRRRGIGGWQSGIIKPKNKKKKEQKQEAPKNDETPTAKSITIPDLNCFTDKSYCFEKGRHFYDCRLCVYSGEDIVNHYKKQHPHTEIPLSRIDQKTAELAIQQCEQKHFQTLSKISSNKYTCRFCHKEFENCRNILETFFWHVVSNHTGEFKRACLECANPSHCPFNLDIPPPPKDGGQLIGYICQKCNFTQISLENLKTHVIVHHNDEQTEVFTINLAVMSNKAINAMLRRAQSEKPRVLRSLRSKQSSADSSDIRDDDSEVSEDNHNNDDCDPSEQSTEDVERRLDEVGEQKPEYDRIKVNLAFENDDPIYSSSVKMEQGDRDVSSQLEDMPVEIPMTSNVSQRGNSDEIVDYPHFKINYTDSGAKEYVCCINRNDNHYKTSLMISMKKHIQTKHSEKWDGYCSLCKVIVTLQGVQSDFRDCLAHFLDKHMDDFPVLEKEAEAVKEGIEYPSESIKPAPLAVEIDFSPAIPVSLSPAIATALSPVIPLRVATPPVERTASPSYIAVRPLAQLISRELVSEIALDQEIPIELPKIGQVVSLGEKTVPPAQPSPSYPINEPVPAPASQQPFLYEDVQAEVMSNKHRVVLDTMMLKENVVRVYKCAGRFCSFTTDFPEDALLHASTHQRVGGEGALQCSYCNYDSCDNGIDLVMHVFKEHSRCQFCCPVCFYRAASSQLVAAHYSKAHAGAAPLKNVLKSTMTPPAAGHSSALLTRDVAVQHYVCKHDDGECNFKTYTPGKFCEHLKQKHADKTSHPCNLCGHRAASPPSLVLHLKAHGLQRYQCTRCVHGAAGERELLEHAAAAHPDALPQAYLRLITNKEGEKRVLPLASLHRSLIPFEDVIPNPTKENPVKEAERSIELEKLIAQTKTMSESIFSQCAAAHLAPEEEAEDFPADHLHDLDELDEPPEAPPADRGPPPAEEPRPAPLHAAAPEPDATTEPPVVKSEAGTELSNDFASDDIICLDSDDEYDAAADRLPTVADHPPSPADRPPAASDDAVLTSTAADTRAEDAGVEEADTGVTDRVSITKLTEQTSEIDEGPTPNRNSSVENIIDLSDDDPVAAATTVAGPEAKPDVYKCPCCPEAFKSPYKLRKHLTETCSLASASKCPYENCQFLVSSVGKLTAHYLQVHAGNAKKSAITCGICRGTFSNVPGAKIHIRSAHKVTKYTVVASLDGSGGETLVINEASGPAEPPRISGRKTSAEVQRYRPEPPPPRSRKPSTEPRKRYGVGDIDKLPISPILDGQVFCELCEFGTKVRLNMVRHLQQHAGNTPVPHTAPVNPVPHLEADEMHFDKMLNLAASSLGARAPPPRAARLPAAEAARYPRLVPERTRYACGARACAYTSLDAAMLRCHWDTLHAREPEFRCRHCPAQQAPASATAPSGARVLSHLRMHGDELYACSQPGCFFYHYGRHFVDRHAADAHPGAGAAALAVREGPAPEPPAAAPTMDLKPWRCGLCDYSSMLRPNVLAHCALLHQSKMQFKCAHCSFRSSAKENVVKHQGNAHPDLPEDVFYYFYREGEPADEAGVPRWQAQRARLGLHDAAVKADPEPAPAPAAAPAAAPAPAPAPAPVDLNLVKEEKEEAASAELAPEALCETFGQFCEPDGLKYKCCLCDAVRDSSRDAMQSHLYEELNYRRWECVICSYKAFHKPGLNEHMSAEHSRQYSAPRALPVDARVERWVRAALDHQAAAIQRSRARLDDQQVQAERAAPAAQPNRPESPRPSTASDAELQNAFGDFGAPKNRHYACPKCEFTARDEPAMLAHLESELSKIRWGCTDCPGKFQTFHEAQFHCKSHTGRAASPRESIRDPSLRSGWVRAVVSAQRQFIKCISESEREPTPEPDAADNSLLVALYEQPVCIEERRAPPARRPAPADSDDERLVIDEPPSKRPNGRKCPYCDYSIHNSRYIREHILKEHYNMKPYVCFYCSFSGTRQAVTAHTATVHAELPKRLVVVEVPGTLPPGMSSKSAVTPGTDAKPDDGETVVSAPAAAKPTKRDAKEEEVAKKVCLYCEKSVPETETESHSHGTEKVEFAKRGDVVVKCCKCLVLRLSIASMQEHFDAAHCGENVLENYAYFKLQVDTREIHCCGHCYKKFKFLRDLKAHHSATHTSLSLSYTSIPFSHNLHTEGDPEVGKRKAEDEAGPSTKRFARKSTSKLSDSAFAKKSTTKLPYAIDVEESSSYGTKPLSMDHYKNVTLTMPMSNSIVEVDVPELSGILSIEPKVVVADYKG